MMAFFYWSAMAALTILQFWILHQLSHDAKTWWEHRHEARSRRADRKLVLREYSRHQVAAAAAIA